MRRVVQGVGEHLVLERDSGHEGFCEPLIYKDREAISRKDVWEIFEGAVRWCLVAFSGCPIPDLDLILESMLRTYRQLFQRKARSKKIFEIENLLLNYAK